MPTEAETEVFTDVEKAVRVLTDLMEEIGLDNRYQKVNVFPQDRPDRHMDACVNFDMEHNPSCIVGRWVERTAPHAFVEADFAMQSTAAEDFVLGLGLPVSDKVLGALIVAQEWQDMLWTYAEVKEAVADYVAGVNDGSITVNRDSFTGEIRFVGWDNVPKLAPVEGGW